MIVRRPWLAAAVCAAVAAPLLPTLAAPAAAAPVTAARTAAPAPGSLGHDRLAVRRGDTWHLSSSLDGAPGRSTRDHVAGWQPVTGDTTGDGTETLHLFKDGWWRLRDREGGPVRAFHFGLRGDQPFLGDWNGDGIDTIGVFRGGRWYVRDVNASGPARVFGFGIPGDRGVVGDWDGNGRTDIAVRRGATWYQRDAASSGPASRSFGFGLAGDVPVAGDWDHDGKDTPGLFRNGTWFLRVGSFPSPYQTVTFGQRGDKPVLLRTPVLAPGVSHRVLRDSGSVVHVSTVDLAASSTPDVVLANDRLEGYELTSAMTRRSGAVVGINGDYAVSPGRPVHLFADDGRLAQSPLVLGRAIGFDATGSQVSMGFPDLRVDLSAGSDTTTVTLPIDRWNAGQGDALAGFSAAGALIETPPAESCYAGIAPAGARAVRSDGAVETPVTVTGTRCGGPAPVVQPTGAVLSARRFSAGEDQVRALRAGEPARLTALLGFPGAVDVIGGNPMLVVEGRPAYGDVRGSGAFFDRNPRTAVGVTGDGRLLLVVVDGRQSGYSAGMTLEELAGVMVRLGARTAVNLDGGGSSTMVVNGVVANRPSDRPERKVSSALVVLPGSDGGTVDLGVLPPAGPAARSGLRREDYVTRGDAAGAAATDPGSTGGLTDALRRQGVRLPAELQRTAETYLRTRE